MALETILEKTTISNRREVLRMIPRSSQLRDDVMDSRRRHHKPAFHPANTVLHHVGNQTKRKVAPQTKRFGVEAWHLGTILYPGQLGASEWAEQGLRHGNEFKIGSGLTVLQTRVPATSDRQCQGTTTLGERCSKLTPAKYCNLHSKLYSLSFVCRTRVADFHVSTARCKGITSEGTSCKRNGPKDGFCFQHVNRDDLTTTLVVPLD
jgi:hypothetical protein